MSLVTNYCPGQNTQLWLRFWLRLHCVAAKTEILQTNSFDNQNVRRPPESGCTIPSVQGQNMYHPWHQDFMLTLTSEQPGG